MYFRGGNYLTILSGIFSGDDMASQNTNSELKEYSPQATIETLLKIIEKSNMWLKKMERDSLIILALLVIMPIAYFVTVLFGNDILQAKIAFLGDLLIPSVIIGVIVFFIIIFYLIRRHLTIRREIKLWQEHLQIVQRNTEDLLSKL